MSEVGGKDAMRLKDAYDIADSDTVLKKVPVGIGLSSVKGYRADRPMFAGLRPIYPRTDSNFPPPNGVVVPENLIWTLFGADGA